MFRVLRALSFVALLVAGSGCVTTKEVRGLLADSNAALEANAVLAETDLPGLHGDDSEQRREAEEKAQAAVRRIDAFLAAHPGQKGTANALIMRKALLLLVSGQPRMAEVAAASYDDSVGGNTRDRALFDSFEVLTWWWEVRAKSADDIDWAGKTAVLTEFSTLIQELPPGEGITYYLATMRANIELKHASVQDQTGMALKEGLSHFSAAFDASARRRVESFVKRPKDLGDVPFDQLRWLAQAKVTYDGYAKVWAAAGLGALAWKPDCKWLQDLDDPKIYRGEKIP